MDCLELDNSISTFDGREFTQEDFEESIFEIKLSNLRIFHKLFDGINISLLILILGFSFFAFKSQREWTKYYSSLTQMRTLNNDLVDFISKTESYYLKEIEVNENLKKATSKDLIYISKSKDKTENKIFILNFKNIIKGLKDSKFQRGY